MRLTKQGIQFNYYGDVLVRKWPWLEGTPLYSPISKKGYLSLRDYWQQVGAHEEALRSKKIEGFMNRDIVVEWAIKEYPTRILVVMRDINHNIKNSNFWKSIPPKYRMELLKDVVILFFSDYQKALDVAKSMDVEFAECYVIKNGFVTANNLDDKSRVQRHEE